MVSGWTWRFETAEGATVVPQHQPGQPFPSQSDAESWLGEVWRELLADGVAQVTLFEEDRLVYGPMSLRPVA